MKTCPVCGATYADSNAFCPTDGTTLRAADTDGDLVGSVVADRYLVTDLLGEGGMGKVYLARHVRLPQQAAIKVLRPDQVRDAASVARFTREAANASRIDHDRVARVYDFGETSDGTVYLAMEYVAGRTLTRLIADEGALPPARTATLVRQIADGLDAAHRLGIIHRDLKPDNVMVIEHEHEDRVKVVDFGIAKALGPDDAGAPALTRTGYVVGTPEFMSPEQLLGGAIDARSDVYALALVAYECLTGDLPFPRDTPDRGLTARLVDAPRRLETVAPAVPWAPAVQQVFDTALAREPGDRPPSAGAFARSLAAAVDAWQIGADRAPAPAVPLPGTATAAMTAPAATAREQSAPAAVPDDRAVTPPRPAGGSRRILAFGGAAIVVAAAVGVALSRSHTGGAEPASGVAAPPTGTSAGNPAPNGSVPPAPTPPAGASNAAAPPAASAPGPAAPVARVSPPSPRPAVPRAAPAEPDAPTAASVPSAGGEAGSARRTLDSLERALDPMRADANAGRAAAGVVGTLLPRLRTNRDSVTAYLRLIDAHSLAGDQTRACAALRSARAAARSAAQRAAVGTVGEQLGCG